MRVEYADTKIEKLCTDQKKAVRELGPQSAGKLRARLDDLAAAACVGELVAGRPHPLKGDRAGQFAVDLASGKRLTFEAADPDPPKTPDNALDWPKVKAVRIKFIGDYHD